MTVLKKKGIDGNKKQECHSAQRPLPLPFCNQPPVALTLFFFLNVPRHLRNKAPPHECQRLTVSLEGRVEVGLTLAPETYLTCPNKRTHGCPVPAGQNECRHHPCLSATLLTLPCPLKATCCHFQGGNGVFHGITGIKKALHTMCFNLSHMKINQSIHQ